MIIRNYNIISFQEKNNVKINKNNLKKINYYKVDNINKNNKFIIKKNNYLKSNLFKKEEKLKENRKKPVKDIQSKNFWIEKTMNGNTYFNSNSLNYNFINHCQFNYKKIDYRKLRENDDKLSFKKKSIAEIRDLQRLHNPNFRLNFKKVLQDDKDTFKRKKGLCSKYMDKLQLNGKTHKAFYNYKL